MSDIVEQLEQRLEAAERERDEARAACAGVRQTLQAICNLSINCSSLTALHAARTAARDTLNSTTTGADVLAVVAAARGFLAADNDEALDDPGDEEYHVALVRKAAAAESLTSALAKLGEER